MKYIKTYEKKSEKFWKIPTKDKEEYIVALNKIGMSEKDIEYWIDIIKPGNYDYILFHNNNGEWMWSGVDSKDYLGQRWIDKPGYQGEVKITPEDIEFYNLKKTAKKYNL